VNEPARQIQTHTLELYNPHAVQREAHDWRGRFLFSLWGRQSGKTSFGLNDVVKNAWEHEHRTYWYLLPTYRQCKIGWRRVKRALSSCSEYVADASKSDLYFTFTTGSTFFFLSAELEENLRMETLDGIYLDEYRNMKPSVWDICRPMLSTTNGFAKFLTTPNGFDHCYDLAEEMRDDPESKFINAPSWCNPAFPMAEVNRLRTKYTEAYFAQEIEAQFRDMFAGKVYVSAGAHNFREDCPFAPGKLYSPALPIVVMMDFNVNPMVWELGQTNLESWWIFDEICVEDTHTEAQAKELVERLKGFPTKANPQVVLTGDATGTGRRSSAAGETDYSLVTRALSEAGITFIVKKPEANPFVKDRVNAYNAVLKSADGSVRFWFNPKRSPELKKDHDKVSWRKGMSGEIEKKKDPKRTHGSDAVGYGIHVFTPITPVGNVGRLRVIRR